MDGSSMRGLIIVSKIPCTFPESYTLPPDCVALRQQRHQLYRFHHESRPDSDGQTPRRCTPRQIQVLSRYLWYTVVKNDMSYAGPRVQKVGWCCAYLATSPARATRVHETKTYEGHLRYRISSEQHYP